jgi:hypothetical protein
VNKFQPLSTYQQPLVDGYQLLPFRFTLLDDHEYVLTNRAGEFIVLERSTLEAMVRHQLPAKDQLYDDLKSKHFIIDRDSSVAMDLFASQSAHKTTAARRLHRIAYICRFPQMRAFVPILPSLSPK